MIKCASFPAIFSQNSVFSTILCLIHVSNWLSDRFFFFSHFFDDVRFFSVILWRNSCFLWYLKKKKLSFFVTFLTKFFIYSLKKFPFDSWFVDKICIFFHDFLPKFGIFRYFTKTAFFLLTFCDVWSFLCLLTRFALFFSGALLRNLTYYMRKIAKIDILLSAICQNLR